MNVKIVLIGQRVFRETVFITFRFQAIAKSAQLQRFGTEDSLEEDLVLLVQVDCLKKCSIISNWQPFTYMSLTRL